MGPQNLEWVFHVRPLRETERERKMPPVVRSVWDRGVISCQATATMEGPAAELEEPIPVGTGRVRGSSKYGV